MKRSIAWIMAGLLILCPFVASAFTAGSISATRTQVAGGAVQILHYGWLGDSNGTVPTRSTDDDTQNGATFSSLIDGYQICGAETSTTAGLRPTDNYTITVTDDRGMDVFDGAMSGNLDSNSTQYNQPTVKSGSATSAGCRHFIPPLTIAVTGNSVGLARGLVDLFFEKP